MGEPKDGKRYWLDDPGNVRRLLWLVTAFGAALFAADAFYDKHPHFEAEAWFGFYAVFGFVAFFLIVMAGKYLRPLLMRPEDYYDAPADGDDAPADGDDAPADGDGAPGDGDG